MVRGARGGGPQRAGALVRRSLVFVLWDDHRLSHSESLSDPLGDQSPLVMEEASLDS